MLTGVATITESGGKVVTITGATLSVSAGTSKGIGGIIASIIGMSQTTTGTGTATASALPQYTGAAKRLEVGLFKGSLVVGGILGCMVWL